jgi:membrane protease YdiL (CAAX protease family)
MPRFVKERELNRFSRVALRAAAADRDFWVYDFSAPMNLGLTSMELAYIYLSFALPTLVGIFASGRSSYRKTWFLWAAATIVVVIYLLAVGLLPDLLPPIPFFDDLRFNWVGKVCAILVGLGLYACLSPELKKEAGVFARPRPPEWISVGFVTALLVGGFCLLSHFYSSGGGTLRLEAILFQATMPGLDEELYLRGIVLALLVAAFGKPWRILGVQVGWGGLCIVAFFGFVHGFSLTDSGVSMDWMDFLITGIAGLLLFWLKERTGSILVPVVAHNLANLGSLIFRY